MVKPAKVHGSLRCSNIHYPAVKNKRAAMSIDVLSATVIAIAGVSTLHSLFGTPIQVFDPTGYRQTTGNDPDYSAEGDSNKKGDMTSYNSYPAISAEREDAALLPPPLKQLKTLHEEMEQPMEIDDKAETKAYQISSSPSPSPPRNMSVALLDTPINTVQPLSRTPGLCGLVIVENTCYMNAALHCLRNTPELAEWFLNDDYEKDINKTNVLGMKGELAYSFARVIKNIWSGNTCVSPKEFKTLIGKYNAQFSGTEQQDSQNYLAF